MLLSVILIRTIFIYLISSATSVNASSCVCTTVPCPVVGINSLATRSGHVGSYIYTDHEGVPVVISVNINISVEDLDTGSQTTSCTQAYSRSLDDDGVKKCDAGHILAHRLGGLGNEPINIFPQSRGVNRGAFAQFENLIYRCIGPSTLASLSWSFGYQHVSSTKPRNVTYIAEFLGGSCSYLSQSFDNSA